MVRRRAAKRTVKKIKTGKIKRNVTEINNIKFDSATEANRYQDLLAKQKKGLVKDIILQPLYVLQPKYFVYNNEIITEDNPMFTDYNKKRLAYNKNKSKEEQIKVVQAIKYKADFKIIMADGTEIVEDVKGIKTTDFKLKEKMLLFRYPTINFRCVAWDSKEKEFVEYNELMERKKLRKKAK